MPTSLDDIRTALDHEDLGYEELEDRGLFVLPFETEGFLNTDGTDTLLIVVEPHKSGRIVQFRTSVIPCPLDSKNVDEVIDLLRLLNRFMLKTMLRATWNADRRGVFLQTSIPLGERALTPEDIMRSASLLLLGARVLVPDINRQLLEKQASQEG